MQFKYTTPVNNCEAICEIELYTEPNSNKALVIATEIPDNPGMSITNAAKWLIAQICDRFALDPYQLTYLERNVDETRETFDFTFFSVDYSLTQTDEEKLVISNVYWVRTSAKEVEDLKRKYPNKFPDN